MNRRIILSIALVVSVVLVSLMSSDSTAKAQNQTRSVWDTGVITLGANQMLRVTMVHTGSGTDSANISFRKMEYSQGTCSADGVCKHSVSSQTTSAPITLAPGEAASIDTFMLPELPYGRVRAMFTSNSRNMKVNVMIIDTITGEVVAIMMDDDLLV